MVDNKNSVLIESDECYSEYQKKSILTPCKFEDDEPNHEWIFCSFIWCGGGTGGISRACVDSIHSNSDSLSAFDEVKSARTRKAEVYVTQLVNKIAIRVLDPENMRYNHFNLAAK